MPRYIDYHSNFPQLPKEAFKEMRAKLGKKDAFGVTPVDALFTSDQKAYCISDGPSADAICKSHEAGGVTLTRGDVHEVVTELK